MTHSDPSFDALPPTQPIELPWLDPSGGKRS
ncbi:hypothetical protein QE381_001453 [Microbacterium sp. SORGH_AS 888]|nr:hypothetical protein [Microbacterium sp. SORGH_AS_0888]